MCALKASTLLSVDFKGSIFSHITYEYNWVSLDDFSENNFKRVSTFKFVPSAPVPSLGEYVSFTQIKSPDSDFRSASSLSPVPLIA